ncbi:hypothetical protein [Frigoriflavimonas asaccharolytica]|uniref:Uncharacterized protein n=1 Tax=Frigoriflavimonas asaccharolytica TaxID=2735899 RepID=A0A8J8GDF5_9FLAO|nr:hypothetical protein [Frigoriflavimonas asaccharolytica]NRS93910.1 hypothetical protein [Frigoriflavimonas asaccharolytica]
MVGSFAEMDKTLTPLFIGFSETLGKKDFQQDKVEMKKLEDSLINNFSKKSVEKEKTIFYFQKINDSIIERGSNKDPFPDSSIFINTKISKEFYDYPYPANDIAFKISYKKIANLKIKEFRKSKKIINGIKCFKIKASYTTIAVLS